MGDDTLLVIVSCTSTNERVLPARFFGGDTLTGYSFGLVMMLIPGGTEGRAYGRHVLGMSNSS